MGFKISKELADKRYRDGNPIVSDQRYDQLFGSEASDMDTPSVTNKVKHSFFMGSLSKLSCVNSEGELDVDTILRNFGGSLLVATWKYDGLAVELKYQNGTFTQAVTRGDGEWGEDITDSVRKMKNLVLSIPKEFTGSLRAEILMLKSDYQTYISTTKDKNPYTNPRNGASGAARSHNGNNCRFCTLKYYGVNDGLWGSERMVFRLLEECDVISPGEYAYCFADPVIAEQMTSLSLASVYECMASGRSDMDFEADGMVVCVNSPGQKQDMGVDTRGRPRYKVAIKFPSNAKETTLRDIEWSVGKGSHITPVAIFDEIDLGVNVTRASLANLDVIKKLWNGETPRTGDVILVSRRGDVIPKVEGVVSSCETGTPLEVPTECAGCGGMTSYDGPFLICPNPSCGTRKLGDILKWIEELKAYFRFTGIGPETIEKLYDCNLVTDICDLYRVDIRSVMGALDLKGTDSEPSKMAQNILTYQEFKEIPLIVFLGAFNTPDVGTSLWSMFVKNTKFNSLDHILSINAGNSEIDAEFFETEVEGLGKTRKDLMYQSIERWRGTIGELLLLGVKVPPYIPATPCAVTPISGKTFCITGGLTKERPAFEAYIQSLGGIPKGGVSKKLDYLIIGDLPGSTKLDKAEKYGIKIINELEFNKLVGRAII